MKPWLRYGLIFGVAAGVATIVVNVLGSLNRPADICVTGKGNLTLTMSGLILFLVIAGAAGWQTTRSGSKISAGALAGLVTGAVSGLPVLVGFVLSLDLAISRALSERAPADTARRYRPGDRGDRGAGDSADRDGRGRGGRRGGRRPWRAAPGRLVSCSSRRG